MGGCASKPKDLAPTEKAPAPVEAPAPPVETPEKVEPETAAPAPQETKDGDETKDKPVVEASEPATKVEEAEADAKPVAKVEDAEDKPAIKAEEPKEAKVEAKAEEKKEAAETVAAA